MYLEVSFDVIHIHVYVRVHVYVHVHGYMDS